MKFLIRADGECERILGKKESVQSVHLTFNHTVF